MTDAINSKAIVAAIEKQATKGLIATGRFALERARHHAPVRSIFDRRRSPRGPAIPVSWRTISSKDRYEAFLRSKSKQRSIGIESESEGAGGSIPAYRVMGNVPTFQRSGIRPKGTRQRRATFSGQANSLLPVFRQKPFTITGNLRRFDPDTGGLLQSVEVIRQRRGTSRRGRTAGQRFRPRVGTMDPSTLLSGRGRYEVRNAEARGLFNGRVGGRLQGEIYLEGPVKVGHTTWVYVVSPTEYARHQEFGTKRSRSHPYLRPALYESRNVLRFEVSKAVDPRFNATVVEEGS